MQGKVAREIGRRRSIRKTRDSGRLEVSLKTTIRRESQRMSLIVRNYSARPERINKSGRLRGGEGGIRTHVPGLPDHLISSQRRYGHFGTSPDSCAILPVMRFIANLHSRSFAN